MLMQGLHLQLRVAWKRASPVLQPGQSMVSSPPHAEVQVKFPIARGKNTRSTAPLTTPMQRLSWLIPRWAANEPARLQAAPTNASM